MTNFQNRTQLPHYDSAKDQVFAELRVAGANRYDMKLPETYYMPTVIKADEHVMAAVYGKYELGRGVLVATDSRVLFIDRKPLFVRCDEIGFGMIGGVSHSRVTLAAILTMHTRLGAYKLRTFNHKAVKNFVDYIDQVCLQTLRKEIHYDFTT
ncbi:MAG: PH domain-containing protein [Patescibacteria group bacterium]|nr:PH domain-containing protein [Patescibacteria group bacterium]